MYLYRQGPFAAHAKWATTFTMAGTERCKENSLSDRKAEIRRWDFLLKKKNHTYIENYLAILFTSSIL